MTEPNISFAGRLSLAFGLFFSVLGDRELARRAHGDLPVHRAVLHRARPSPVRAGRD
ncbi:DUF2760 domain-containing protein, partial [Burkholderia pseudomallei]